MLDTILFQLAEGEPHLPWYHGIHLGLESTEFLLVVIVFFAVLAIVYYIQRWIGDY